MNDKQENEILQALCTRRSIREYDPARKVEQEKLEAILTAAQYAPTGRNRMTTKFVVVENTAMRKKLSDWNAEILGTNCDPFYHAPAVILVLADAATTTWVEDGSLAIGAMLTAAYAEGLGACWIHRAREMFDCAEGKLLLQQWGIPTQYRGVGFCIVGYAAGNPPEPLPRKKDQIIWVS